MAHEIRARVRVASEPLVGRGLRVGVRRLSEVAQGPREASGGSASQAIGADVQDHQATEAPRMVSLRERAGQAAHRMAHESDVPET